MSISKNDELLRKYMYETKMNSKDKILSCECCWVFGYLDGYFDEITYENNFEKNDGNNASYEKGYLEGVNRRIVTPLEKMIKEKREWVIRLAIHDGKNNIDQRNFKKFEELYSVNYQKSKCLSFNNIEKYMYTTEMIKGNNKLAKEQSYVYGYLNGYFDEITYGSYFVNEDECYMYELGYNEGIKDRNLDLKKAKLEKLKWVIKLAIYDRTNNITNRCFSSEMTDFYNINYHGFKGIFAKDIFFIEAKESNIDECEKENFECLNNEQFFNFQNKKVRKYFN